jgi:hypothetical protein
MSCTICNHPDRQAIDQALAAGSATLVALGQQYGLSTSALHRHKAHLKAKVSRAQDQLQENLRQGCIFWLSQALAMAMQTAKTAQAEGNSKIVLKALAQGTRLVTIILKQDLHLDDRLIYEILANPQWTSRDSLLPDDPGLMALGRQSLAETLSSPCPETPAEAPSSASPEERALMQQFLQVLASDLAPQTSTEIRKLETEKQISKREKSGKLSGKTPFRKVTNEENQEDKYYEKIAGMMDLVSLAGPASLHTRNSKLETLLANSNPIPGDKPLSEYIYEQSLRANLDAKNGLCHAPKSGKGAPHQAI